MGSEISTILFYAFGVMAIICAVAVIAAKNPVTSAMSMALCFAATAGIYFGMGAQFLGIVQLIVYAGAILVLFLFIVMMLDIKAEEESKRSRLGPVPGCCIAGVFAGLVTTAALALPGSQDGHCPIRGLVASANELLIGDSRPAEKDNTQAPQAYGGRLPELSPAAAQTTLRADSNSLDMSKPTTQISDTKLIGQTLFTQYNIAFTILGFALLAGTVGAVAVGRKYRKD